MGRLRIATIWLGGCSGCHMSFLDLDEFLIDLADLADIVYTPVIDTKEFPENVDVVLVEGAVANEDNLAMIRKVRQRSRMLIAFGDCAVTGNVTALRNSTASVLQVLERSYIETADPPQSIPCEPGIVPPLLPKVLPVHNVVHVDLFLPGCPPSAKEIRAVLEQVLAGNAEHMTDRRIRFG